jgi:hypothetical protein
MAWAGASAGATMGAAAAQRIPECIGFVGFNGAYHIGLHLVKFGGAENIKASSLWGKLTPVRLQKVSAILQIFAGSVPAPRAISVTYKSRTKCEHKLAPDRNRPCPENAILLRYL